MRGLRYGWRATLEGLWLVPTVCVALGIALGFLLVEISDQVNEELLRSIPSLYGISGDGARGILTSIAVAMLSLAGVLFSITMVTLSLTANQYTSRVLRTFIRDRGNQAVLGTFLGLFAYCLVVLRTIRGTDATVSSAVPSLAVLAAVVFAMVGLGMFIYFIHHTAVSIQASHIVSSIAQETSDTVRAVAERRDGWQVVDQPDPLPDRLIEWHVRAEAVGYVRAIDRESLLHVAERAGPILVRVNPGDFVNQHDAIASIGMRRGQSDQEGISSKVRNAFVVARSGDLEQDPSFGVRQLVDIAVKALSPGINDPTTAVTVIDYLGAVLLTVIEVGDEPTGYRDERGAQLLHVPGYAFSQLLALAFDQIREHGASQQRVLSRLLETLAALEGAAEDQAHRQALSRQVRLLVEVASRGIASSDDLAELLRASNELDSRLLRSAASSQLAA